jgi:hypothetical protein
MNAKLGAVPAVWVTLIASACGSAPQKLILGKWEVDTPMDTKMTVEFNDDGTARLGMLGQTVRGTYKLSPENELEWTVNGMSTKGKVKVSATELEVTDDANHTIKYKRP